MFKKLSLCHDLRVHFQEHSPDIWWEQAVLVMSHQEGCGESPSLHSSLDEVELDISMLPCRLFRVDRPISVSLEESSEKQK